MSTPRGQSQAGTQKILHAHALPSIAKRHFDFPGDGAGEPSGRVVSEAPSANVLPGMPLASKEQGEDATLSADDRIPEPGSALLSVGVLAETASAAATVRTEALLGDRRESAGSSRQVSSLEAELPNGATHMSKRSAPAAVSGDNGITVDEEVDGGVGFESGDSGRKVLVHSTKQLQLPPYAPLQEDIIDLCPTASQFDSIKSDDSSQASSSKEDISDETFEIDEVFSRRRFSSLTVACNAHSASAPADICCRMPACRVPPRLGAVGANRRYKGSALVSSS
jgi:hypothetical protein